MDGDPKIRFRLRLADEMTIEGVEHHKIFHAYGNLTRMCRDIPSVNIFFAKLCVLTTHACPNASL